jgi:hypothetical protein
MTCDTEIRVSDTWNFDPKNKTQRTRLYIYIYIHILKNYIYEKKLKITHTKMKFRQIHILLKTRRFT